MLYFAYGSNMSERRLKTRVPAARKMAVATLPGHQLMFHKKSEKDGSAKCDAWRVSDSNHSVMGVLFKINPLDKVSLDSTEGLGVGYHDRRIWVISNERDIYEAFAYFALRIDFSLKPYHWYKEHVLRGALENGLPESYIRSIQCVESIDDPNSARTDHELHIYQ